MDMKFEETGEFDPLTDGSRTLTGLLREVENQVSPLTVTDHCELSGHDLRLPIAQGEDLFRDFVARRLCV